MTDLKKNITDFVYTNYYIAFIALLALFFWTSGWMYLGFAVLVIIGCSILLAQRDMTPIIPIVLAFLFMIRKPEVFSSIWIYLTFIPAVGCLIAHFIIYPIKKVKLGKLFFPLLAVFGAFLLGGVGSKEISNYSGGLVRVFGIGFAMLAVYFLISQYLCPDRDTRDYTFYTLIIICFVPCIEMFFVDLVLKLDKFSVQAYGWGNTGFIGYAILVAIPACYYFMARTQKLIPYFLVLLFLGGSIIFASHDGGIGLLGIMLPVITVFTYRFIQPQKRFLYRALFYGGAILALGVFFLYISSSGDIFTVLVDKFLDDTGRTSIYRQAIERFLLYPVFGNGAYYPSVFGIGGLNGQVLDMYHSVFFHPLATMGIVGIAAYGWLIFARFKILTQKTSLFNFYAVLSALLFQIYAFIDCGEFLMIVLILNFIVMITENVNEWSNDLPHIYPKWIYGQKDFI